MARFPYLALLCLALAGGCSAAPRATPRRGGHDVEGQIVGGHDADIADYPWQVSFRLRGSHVCGGSVLNENWVLTAAHCVKGSASAAVVSVLVGSSSKNGGGRARAYRAAFMVAHPAYALESAHSYDVGLVRLAEPIAFGPTVQPVKLARKGSDPADGETLIVTGWGRDGEHGYPRDTLQSVAVPAVDRASCARAYSSRGSRIDSTMVCAGYRQGGMGSCKGDSGGPVVDGEGVQVGIVSWGAGCATPGLPGVYASVGNGQINSWIESYASQTD